MFIIKKSLLTLTLAATFVFLSIISVFTFGFNPSIDFSGGTLYEVAYKQSISNEREFEQAIRLKFPGSEINIQEGTLVTIKTTTKDQESVQALRALVAKEGSFSEVRLNTLGSSFSRELVNKSIAAILFVIVFVVCFIAYTFRGVSAPVASWKYGVVAIVALIHDTVIPIGIFAFLGSIFINFQIDVLFITAILATLGYSVNDTIVVFDRVRENLFRKQEKGIAVRGEKFKQVVGQALESSIRRSIFTSLTTLLVLLILFFVGGPTTQAFALVLAIGVVAGTYSSLAVACPLLLSIEKYSKDTIPLVNSDGNKDTGDLPEDVQRFLEKQKK